MNGTRLQAAYGRGMRLFGLAAAVLVVAASFPARSKAANEDRAFTVGSYPVEARAADAVSAKNKAIADGQQAAFRSLLKRIVPVTLYGQIDRLKGVKAGDLIESFAVRSERNSSTEYIATYDFVFQAEGVRRILDREGIPFLDRQAPQVTIIPVYRGPAGRPPSDALSDTRGSDSWLYAWKGLDLANALAPVNLTPPKRELAPELLKALADGDGAAVRSLSAEYQTETLVIALLEPDPGQKVLRVTLAGRDAVAPFALKRSYRMGSNDLAYTAELAAVISLGVLEGRWKAINLRGVTADGQPGNSPQGQPAGADSTLHIAVQFRSMGEWQQISRQLSQTPDVSGLEVEGLSARGARVALRYPGGPQSLAVTLAQYGLILQNAGGNWVLAPR